MIRNDLISDLINIYKRLYMDWWWKLQELYIMGHNNVQIGRIKWILLFNLIQFPSLTQFPKVVLICHPNWKKTKLTDNGQGTALFKIVIHQHGPFLKSSMAWLFVFSGIVPYTIFVVVVELFGFIYDETAEVNLYPWVRKWWCW